MKIVFFGTPGPAAEVLKTLIEVKREVVAVVTQPDRPKGRGQKVVFSAVKEVALKAALPLEQPESVKNNPVFKAFLKSRKPDIGVVVAYGKILPKDVLEIPKYGFINIHASLLPKYRGAAPIQWALLKGEKESGVTIFKLVEALDAGPILAQKSVPIGDDDDYETLSTRLFDASKKLLIEALSMIESGKAEYVPQNEAEATFAPTLTKESGEIDWRKSAVEINDRIRGLIAWPVAHSYYHGKCLKVLRAKLHVLDLAAGPKLPGTIIHVLKGEGLIVATGQGNLLINEVQPEAGKRMNAYEFAIGHRLTIGETLPS